MNILGIETSCDETAVAIVNDGKEILSSVVASSTGMHRKYGGIVPEVAAREQLKVMIPTLTEAMTRFTKDDIDAIAVTVGPGLIGSLLVGVETAKTLAFNWNKPIIPVNHVLAHMYANFVITQDYKNHEPINFPAISLVVSGGHTEIYLMTDDKTLQWLGGTTDDAAGEAFDKSARLLGFENKGGPAIAQAAELYSSSERSESRSFIKNDKESSRLRSNNIVLPRPLLHDDTLNFSFSGLKTAVLREWSKLPNHTEANVQEFAHEIQEAITDVLVIKTLRAVKSHGAKSILVSGGVAANQRLREKFIECGSELQVHFPPPALATDNAAAIAACAYYQSSPLPWQQVTAQPNLTVEI